MNKPGESFNKAYDAQKVEGKIYRLWEKSGYFNPDKLPGPRKKSFTIAVPPPNITGSLHMGHALNSVIQDILIRKKRMEGYKTLWLPGTDHAGIATQNVVEKDLKKQGITRRDLGRDKFLEKVWQWKEKYGHIILDQFKKLGSSMDWSRTRFTMDPDYQKAVKKSFMHYYDKGLIYRAERVINWCIHCATSLSDLELERKELETNLYYIKYPLKTDGFITVATTRPETMLGDSAIAVNPKDERYKKLIGKTAILPIVNREVPIVGDRKIDLKFGTGAVKVTPAHDVLDAEIGERNDLPVYKIIGPNGKMTKEAGSAYEGLKISECRESIIEELKKLDLLEKQEPYKHNLAVCYRCGTIIEPMPSLQWFLKMDGLAEKAMGAVKSGRVKFYPKKWEKVYFDWLKEIKDWCISRQIWWGHKIPIKGENDVLDTWFSSALWPFATLGWPGACGEVKNKKSKTKICSPQKETDLANFYPTQVLSTARDIINLWVARMIFSGEEFLNKEPFSKIIIHATVLNKEGKRMSKSLGTGVDPMDLINQYGADATRFGLIWQSMGTQDIHWAEESVVAGKKFSNKIWNASRFILTNCNFRIYPSVPQISKSMTIADKKILNQLQRVKKSVENDIENFRFGHAIHQTYDFFWHNFCDIYLEKSKRQFENPKIKVRTKKILICVLLQSLKLLHPFMPFITEEIYQNLPIRRGSGQAKNKKLLIIEKW